MLIESYLNQPCIEWQGARTKSGYGQKKVNGVTSYAHRLAFEKAWGIIIPQDKVIMHTCDNPSCVNPFHLRLGTQKENLQDMRHKGRRVETVKTHCIRGHEFTEQNTYVTPDGLRQCRTCKLIRQREYRA